ncbi:substrate-binding domain-containing protein [Arthrobacter sp. NPDC080031]|uniref:sugar ABC transporter substrate-binding protein n=1 Tax=Arthrobacter sp. NPDC080031 TaxID=3155918 RepID=UPI0034505299
MQLTAAIAAVGSMFLLSACSGTSGAGGSTASGGGEQIVIGVAMKTQQQRRWGFDVAAMQKKADEIGVKLIVQYANDDANTQSSQIENLLSQGVKALIVTPVDDKAAGSSVNQAKAQGVPVISYDVGIQGVPVDYFVVRDNDKVGVLQAEAAQAFKPEGNYALIEGDPANDVAQAIHKNHLSTLQGKPAKIVYDQFTKNWDPSTALSTAENVLSSNNDNVSAFLTANDGMASSAVQALRGRGLAGKVFVSGLDADPANLKLIDEGVQTMSVWTQIDQQGAIAVDVAAKLAKGQKPQPQKLTDNGSANPIPTMLVPVVSVTKNNLCDFVNKIAPKGWVTAKDVFADPSTCPAS